MYRKPYKLYIRELLCIENSIKLHKALYMYFLQNFEGGKNAKISEYVYSNNKIVKFF